MDWQFTPYVLPLLGAAAISVGLAYYAHRRKAAPGATAFIIMVLMVAQWSLGYALELGFADLSAKIFWAKVEYLGIVILPLTWLAFALQYTRRDQWLTRRTLILLSIVPLITLLLVWTNQAHGLIWSHIGLAKNGPFVALAIAYGPWFWVHSIFSYLLLLAGTVWLIFMLLRSPYLYRQQAGTILLGLLAPWVGNGLYLAGFSPVRNLDLTPFAFTLSGFIFAWGLLRFRLLEIVPVARRAVVDGMTDGVIVLDTQDRIVDLNPAARQIMGPAASGAIGQPVAQVLAHQADLINRYRGVLEAHTEITLGDLDARRHYELHISPLNDQYNHLMGRLVVLHDITIRKQAEEALRDQKQLFESLVAVARATTGQPALQATLQNALNVATTLTGAELGSLLLLDENRGITHNISAFGAKTPAQTQEFMSQVMDKGLAGWVARRRQATLIADTEGDDRWLPLPEQHPQAVRSALAVPIVSGSTSLGILTLAHSTPGYFTAEHLELMQAAADQMALAVRNAQIFDAQRRLADRQTALYQVLRAVAEQTDPNQVGRVAVETIAQFAGRSNVIIALPDKDGRYWIAHAVSEPLAEMAGQKFPMKQSAVGLAFETTQTQLVTNVRANPACKITANPNTCAVLAVPLRRGQNTLGVLALESQQPAAFDPDDLLLAESLAEAVALTMDNARLHAETQRRLKEQIALREASSVISATLELPTVLSRLAEQLGQAVNVTSTYICSYEPATMMAPVLASYFGPQASGAEQAANLNATYYLPRDFPNLIPLLRSGQPGLTHVDNPYLPERHRTHMQRCGAQTTLTIPLQIRGETIAYAELRESRRRREFSPEEIALCQGIAQQAAIAIENARLYDETHQHAAGLSALYTVTRMVNQSLVLEDVLLQALSSAMILLDFEAGVITLADPNSGQLRVAAERGLPRVLSAYFQQSDLHDTLCQYVYTHPQVLPINDLRQEAPVDVSELVVLGLQAYVGIPLLHGKQVLGSMSLFTRQPRPSSSQDLALLTTIGNQVAVAVANARLFQTITGQHSRLQALIESSRDGVLMVGMDRRVLVTNVPAIKLLGLSGKPEDWIGRPIADILAALRHHAPAAARATIAEMRRIGRGDEPSAEGEYEALARTTRWLNLPVLAETTPLGRLIVLRDVTEERLLEKMRDDLTHTMVHDLRNPLTAILNAVELICQAPGQLSPTQNQLLEIARNRTRSMAELVNSILDVSRLESNRMPLNRSLVSLADLIGQTLQAQSPLAAEKKLKLASDLSPNLPPICVDARLIERVLQNLVGNAIKFAPEGGWVRISVSMPDETATKPAHGSSPSLHLSVSDNGPGISPELQSRLFQKFTTGRQLKSGSGLGLAFCKLAVEAHNGQIWVESEPNQGATFHITLPLSQNESEE